MFEVIFNVNGRNQSISVFETMEHAQKFLQLCNQPNTIPKGNYLIAEVTLEELRKRIKEKKK